MRQRTPASRSGLDATDSAANTAASRSSGQGPPGEDGEPGEQGPPGARGADGAAGSAGAVGSSGARGAPGEDGAEGEQGPIGPAGPAGSQGTAGTTGATGAQGIQGAQGIAGADGLDGDDGPRVPVGPQGAQGTAGVDAVGIQGTRGLPGDDGLDGDMGPPGPQGTPGTAGSTGATGIQGAQGVRGEDGQDGDDAFIRGAAGAIGPAGATGATGDTGQPGSAVILDDQWGQDDDIREPMSRMVRNEVQPGLMPALVGRIASRSTTASIANTETQVTGTTLSARVLKVGTIIRASVQGILTNTTSASTSVWRMRIGSSSLSGAIVASWTCVLGTTARTNVPFEMVCNLVVLTTGASGTAWGIIVVNVNSTTALALPTIVTAAVTIDTTAADVVEMTVISGAATTTWNCVTAYIEAVHQP